MTAPTPIRSAMIETQRPAADLQDPRRATVEAVARRRPARRRGRDLRVPRARTGPARRRRSGCSRPSSRRRRARRRSPARDLRREPQLVRQPHRLRARRAARPIRPRRVAASSSSRAGSTACRQTAARRARPRSSRRSTSRRPPTGAPARYSGGMRRRLDVGLGIVHRPQVLFLDEPTTGLDPQARARMWDEIRALREHRDDRLPDDPLPRGGRRAVRPPRDHRPRPDRRRGHVRRAQAGQVAGDVVTIGVNGSGAQVLALVEAHAVRPRGVARRRGRPRPALRRPRRDRRAAPPPEPRRGRASRRPRSRSTSRASTTSSSARPGARCARRRHDRRHRRHANDHRPPKGPPACELSATPG